METFIYGVLAAAVSGAAVIAYRHPTAYAALFRQISVISGLALVVYLAFWVGTQVGPEHKPEPMRDMSAFLVFYGGALLLRMIRPVIDLFEDRDRQ